MSGIQDPSTRKRVSSSLDSNRVVQSFVLNLFFGKFRKNKNKKENGFT